MNNSQTRQYKRKWAQKNRDKINKAQRDYRRLHPKEAREWDKRYYQNHKETELKRRRRYARSLRLEVLVHYGGNPPKCGCCDEMHIEFLSIDHINGGGNKQRKEGLYGLRLCVWLKDENYPSGYQVLCHNCNMAKGFYGECPHRRGDGIDGESSEN